MTATRTPAPASSSGDQDYVRRLYEGYYPPPPADQRTAEAVFAGRLPYLDRLVRDRFPSNRGASVLDLGCGAGALIFAARARGFSELGGVDRSPVQVALAHRLGLTSVELGDVFETLAKLEDSARDVVVAFDVLEHLPKKDVIALADEVHRVLRVGGRFITHTPNGNSPFFGRVRYGDFTHEQVFTPASIRQVMEVAGFSRTECFEDRPVIHGLRSAARALGWHVLRSALIACLVIEAGSAGPDAIVSQNFLTVAYR